MHVLLLLFALFNAAPGSYLSWQVKYWPITKLRIGSNACRNSHLGRFQTLNLNQSYFRFAFTSITGFFTELLSCHQVCQLFTSYLATFMDSGNRHRGRGSGHKRQRGYNRNNRYFSRPLDADEDHSGAQKQEFPAFNPRGKVAIVCMLFEMNSLFLVNSLLENSWFHLKSVMIVLLCS